MGQKIISYIAKEEEQGHISSPTKKEVAHRTTLTSRAFALKDKVVEPFIATKEQAVQKVKTWRDQVKLLILLPLSLLSEICCRRRIPAQFYKPESTNKSE